MNVHIRGILDDGRRFIDTRLQGGIPINVTLDEGRFPLMVEDEIRKMKPGGSITIHVPVEEAFGEYNPELIEKIPKNQVNNADNLPIGQYVMFPAEGGAIRVKVVSVDDDFITFDHNHELAGHDLTYEIDLIKKIEKQNDWVQHEKFYASKSCGCKDALCDCAE